MLVGSARLQGAVGVIACEEHPSKCQFSLTIDTAQRLEMGSWIYVSNLLREQPLRAQQEQLPLCE
jgi:hypothetical protein